MTIHDPRHWTGLIQFYPLISDPVLSSNTGYLPWTLVITSFRFLEMAIDDFSFSTIGHFIHFCFEFSLCWLSFQSLPFYFFVSMCLLCNRTK